MHPHTPHPGLGSRFLAAACYLGLAPLLPRSALQRRHPYVQHHHQQALALGGLFLFMLGLSLVVSLVCSYLLAFERVFYESFSVETCGNALSGIGAVVFMVALLAGLVQALCNSRRGIPLIRRLVRRRRLVALSRGGCLSVEAGLVFIVAMTIHAGTLTRDLGKPGRAYMLYIDEGVLPPWLFDLGFYRIALAATERWGMGSVVVTPLSYHSFEDAVAHGEFVFVCSHGRDGAIWYDQTKVIIQPDAHVAERVGPGLRFIYLTACDGGRKEDQWREVFAPAEVKTFDRLSAVLEHIYWLWVRGPRVIEDLGGSPSRAVHMSVPSGMRQFSSPKCALAS